MLDLQRAAGNRAVGGMLGTDEVAVAARVGADPERVRIHADPQSDRLARELGAKALAVGQHVFLRAGDRDAAGPDRRELVAHELAHTVQARAEPAPEREPYLVVDRSDSPAERAATATAGGAGRMTEPAAAEASGATVHLQTETTRTPTIVVFGPGRNDVEGARRTAERLASKIKRREMTEDDYEVLRQAGGHFQGRAARVFHEVIQSSIADRDVLAEVARQAPPQPTGTRYSPPILIAPKLDPGNVAHGRRAGRQHADRLRGGTVTEEQRDEVESHIRYFEGKAREAYRAEIARALEEVKAKTERHQPAERKLLGTRESEYGPDFGPTSRFEEVHTEVIPTGPPTPGFSFSVTVIAEVRKQTSDSVSVEYYTDVSGGAEVSVKIPIVKDVVDVKLGGGVKAGRKDAEKRETANVKIEGNRISRTYQVQELEREVVRKTFRSVSDETRPKSRGAGLGLVITDPVERALVESASETQVGYRVTSTEDKTTREVWPGFSGRRESLSASQALSRALKEDGARLAGALARLVGGR